MTRQLRVTMKATGQPADLTVIGSVSFTKGVSQYMPDDAAESHKRTIEAIDANADVPVKEGAERPPFVQKYAVELLDPDQARATAHAEFVAAEAASASAAPVPVPDGPFEDDE